MSILRCLFLFASFAVSAYSQNDVRLPPSIKSGPKVKEAFRETEEITLPCKAEGSKPLTYEWKLNGVILHVNLPKFRFHGVTDGDLTIISATRLDDGFYQCFATNQYGTALSTVIHIQYAFLQEATQSFANVTAQDGRPFVIEAARRNSYPTPIYNWETATAVVDKNPRPFQSSSRVRTACNGDLHFAYAEKADDLSGHIYKSIVYNPVTDQRLGGSYTRVMVTTGSGTPPDFPPNITYFAKSQEVALIGRDIELKCFFSGKPLPDITWSRPGNNLPSGRNNIPSEHFKTILNITNIMATDEGDYVCTATNTMGRTNHTLNVRVEAVPTFKRVYDGPYNVNVTEGDSITFNCSAVAKPEATVVWLMNGKSIDAPKRFVLSNDKKSLTIRDVCRDCVDRESKTDLMVIQCNASNVHGYAFASGYLNVLLRTKVTLKPPSTVVSIDPTKENQFKFDCSATSDPSTPLTIQWFKFGEQGRELVYNEPPYVYVTNGNLTMNFGKNCSTTCEKYYGEYRCIGDNGYTQDTATFLLNGTIETTEKPPILQGYLMWIVIAIAIGLFLLILLLICCIVCYLNKGDEYDVDGKERKSGKIPEEELLSNDFQEFFRSEDVKRKGSGASMGSTVMFKSMDDLNEYEEDVNFGEDGSFVGKYA